MPSEVVKNKNYDFLAKKYPTLNCQVLLLLTQSLLTYFPFELKEITPELEEKYSLEFKKQEEEKQKEKEEAIELGKLKKKRRDTEKIYREAMML